MRKLTEEKTMAVLVTHQLLPNVVISTGVSPSIVNDKRYPLIYERHQTYLPQRETPATSEVSIFSVQRS